MFWCGVSNKNFEKFINPLNYYFQLYKNYFPDLKCGIINVHYNQVFLKKKMRKRGKN